MVLIRILFYQGLLKTIIAGGMGGISLWATIYPADVIKSRSQVCLLSDNSYFFMSVFSMHIFSSKRDKRELSYSA